MFRYLLAALLCIFLSVSSAPALSSEYANFENNKVPEAVQKELNEARSPTAFGFPKFKRVTYVYASEITRANGKKEVQNKIEISTDDGLIRIRQEFSPFGVDYLAGFGGMVLFKSRGFGTFADGSVSVSDKMNLALPVSPIGVGARVEMRYEMIRLPTKSTELRVQINETCEVTKLFEAKMIFPSLTGQAMDMTCSGSDATSKNYIRYKNYLEDLGLVVLATIATNQNAVVTRFVSFDVEK